MAAVPADASYRAAAWPILPINNGTIAAPRLRQLNSCSVVGWGSLSAKPRRSRKVGQESMRDWLNLGMLMIIINSS
jgi:hypothetical protein